MDVPIRIGIVDDHPGVRVAVRGLLASAKDVVVIGEGVNGLEAIQLANAQEPDVLLLDVELPSMNGYEAVRRIRESNPNVKVLALSSYNDPMYILGMLENGADGYITKDEAPRLLLTAVHSIINDRVKWISPEVAKQVSHIQLDDKTFTGRELEILRYIVLGKPNVEIMHSLDISENLLHRYIEILMEKFNTSSVDDLKASAEQVISTERS
jgi:DNA-binding NarL/FixJ family response regulator